jgi:hypothetical protein
MTLLPDAPLVKPLACSIVIVAAALAPRPSRAQANYRSSPSGGRSALMGDTGVALGRDGSAPFRNPATIVRVLDSNLAFSVNFYNLAISHFSGWHQPGAVDTARFGNVGLDDTSITTNKFDALPSTLCFFFTVAGFGDASDDPDAQDAPGAPDAAGAPAPRAVPADVVRRGRQKLALCLGSVERDEVGLPALNFRGGTAGGVAQQAQSMTHKWSRIHVGPTYAAYLTNDLAVGLSLHGVYTYDGFINAGSSVTSGTPGGAIASELGSAGEGHSLDLAAILGLTYRFDRITLGVSGQLSALHVLGGYDANLHEQYAGAPGQSALLTTGSGNFHAPPPSRLSFGVGAELKKTKLEIDASYFFPMDAAVRSAMHVDTVSVTGTTSTPSSFDAEYIVRAGGVLDVSLGAERFVTPSLSVLGGLSTDFTAAPPLSPTMTLADFYQARTSRVALSFGVGSYGESGELLLGTQLSYGWGTALAVNPYVLPNTYSVVDTQTYGAMIILAGSTNLRAIRRAVEKVQDVVTKGIEKKTAP